CARWKRPAITAFARPSRRTGCCTKLLAQYAEPERQRKGKSPVSGAAGLDSISTGSVRRMSQALAKLALEDGTVYTGRSFGAVGEKIGEVVFNTSMTGYQEVLTDPSYKGQIVTMTYPLIGNYGVNPDDQESQLPQVEGFVVRELTPLPSNFRSQVK